MDTTLILVLTPIWNTLSLAVKDNFISFEEFVAEVKLTIELDL